MKTVFHSSSSVAVVVFYTLCLGRGTIIIKL